MSGPVQGSEQRFLAKCLGMWRASMTPSETPVQADSSGADTQRGPVVGQPAREGLRDRPAGPRLSAAVEKPAPGGTLVVPEHLIRKPAGVYERWRRARSAPADSTELVFRRNRPRHSSEWTELSYTVANDPTYSDHPPFKGPGSLRSDRAASLKYGDPGNLLDRIRDHGIAAKLGVKPEALAAVIEHESRGDPAAENEMGYVGLMQWSPAWRANWFGRKRVPVTEQGEPTPPEPPLSRSEDARYRKAMKNMTVEQQLDLIEDYFSNSSWHTASKKDINELYRTIHAGGPFKTAKDGISGKTTLQIITEKVGPLYEKWKGN